MRSGLSNSPCTPPPCHASVPSLPFPTISPARCSLHSPSLPPPPLPTLPPSVPILSALSSPYPPPPELPPLPIIPPLKSLCTPPTLLPLHPYLLLPPPSVPPFPTLPIIVPLVPFIPALLGPWHHSRSLPAHHPPPPTPYPLPRPNSPCTSLPCHHSLPSLSSLLSSCLPLSLCSLSSPPLIFPPCYYPSHNPFPPPILRTFPYPYRPSLLLPILPPSLPPPPPLPYALPPSCIAPLPTLPSFLH